MPDHYFDNLLLDQRPEAAVNGVIPGEAPAVVKFMNSLFGMGENYGGYNEAGDKLRYAGPTIGIDGPPATAANTNRGAPPIAITPDDVLGRDENIPSVPPAPTVPNPSLNANPPTPGRKPPEDSGYLNEAPDPLQSQTDQTNTSQPPIPSARENTSVELPLGPQQSQAGLETVGNVAGKGAHALLSAILKGLQYGGEGINNFFLRGEGAGAANRGLAEIIDSMTSQRSDLGTLLYDAVGSGQAGRNIDFLIELIKRKLAEAGQAQRGNTSVRLPIPSAEQNLNDVSEFANPYSRFLAENERRKRDVEFPLPPGVE